MQVSALNVSRKKNGAQETCSEQNLDNSPFSLCRKPAHIRYRVALVVALGWSLSRRLAGGLCTENSVGFSCLGTFWKMHTLKLVLFPFAKGVV